MKTEIAGFTAADLPTKDELSVILREPALADASERSAGRREREMRAEEQSYQRSLAIERETHRARLASIEAYHAKRRATLFGEHEGRLECIINGMVNTMRQGRPFPKRFWIIGA